MSVKSNLTIVLIALVMTLGIWMMPQTISAESHKQRILTTTTYNTNPTRTNAVIKNCVGVTDRSQLVSTDQVSTSQQYKAQLASQFTLNGNTLINKLIGGDSSGAIQDVQTDQTAFGLFIGFFIVGFLVLLLVWSFLICCCCCPSCCPSKCCQKNQNQQYTKCQLYWPSIALILCLLLIIAASALGLAKASNFKDGLDDTTCAVSMMFDDIINGNVTSNGNYFFIGVTQLINQINVTLRNNMADINGNITQLTGATMTAAKNDVSTAKTNIQKVPNNAAADGNATITYTTAFNDTYNAANPTISSILVQLLGSSNNGGLIGAFYSAMDVIYTTLSGIISSSSSFTGSSAAFSSAITGIASSLGDFKTTLDDLNSNVQTGLSLLDTPKSTGTMVIQLFYGVALGFACLALIGVVLMTFCDKYKCRYLMYFACVILFFFGLLGFLIAILFSFIVPVMYWGCDWISITIGSSAGFNANMATLISDASTRSYISPCLSGGTGDLMTAVAPGNAATLTDLKSSITNTNSFNSSSQIASINSAVTTLTTTINNFDNGNTPDITDASAIATLVYVSDPSNFSPCTAINTDSWVVSNGNSSYTSCHVSGGASVDFSTGCNTRAKIQTNNVACQGCIDSTSIFNNLYDTAAAVSRGNFGADLILKYNTAVNTNCVPFTTFYGNVWDNYYFTKIPKVQAIKSRWATASTSITTVITDLGTINTTMTSVINSLSTTVDSVIDPQYGLIAGLNCLLIGEDIEMVVNTICVTNFNTLYINRLAMGIAAFGILFALCCIVCSGVRHYKHAERKDKISPNFMMDAKHSFEDTDAAFRP